MVFSIFIILCRMDWAFYKQVHESMGYWYLGFFGSHRPMSTSGSAGLMWFSWRVSMCLIIIAIITFSYTIIYTFIIITWGLTTTYVKLSTIYNYFIIITIILRSMVSCNAMGISYFFLFHFSHYLIPRNGEMSMVSDEY